MNETVFVETNEHRRFCEFCDACRQYHYIGLCYGPPGVGKTFSARHYANWDKVGAYQSDLPGCRIRLEEVIGSDVVFYTVQVVNSAGQVRTDIAHLRDKLRALILSDLYAERDRRISEVYEHEAKQLEAMSRTNLWYRATDVSGRTRTEALEQIHEDFRPKLQARPDPTQLILIDEADRLKMMVLDQVRAIFDEGGVGLVLIGMPGMEKRLARYAQLYSRIGFVHEFRPLTQGEIRRLLVSQWRPRGVSLLDNAFADEDAIATIVRVTGGNFRLLDRLLTQAARVLDINQLDSVTVEVVEAARESLVIGTS